MTPNAHLAGKGCPKCGHKASNESKMLTLEEVHSRFINKHGDKYGYEKFKYFGTGKKGEIFCKACAKYFWQTPKQHFDHGCNRCGEVRSAKIQTKSQEQFIQKCIEVHGPDTHGYEKVIYQRNKDAVQVRHVKCGRYFFVTPNNHLRGSSCPFCRESRGAKEVNNILETYPEIEIIREETITGCRHINPLRFDFQLFRKGKLIGVIEFNGSQHYQPVRWTKKMTEEEAQKLFQDTVNRDIAKYSFCNENEIPLLIISYNQKTITKNLIECFLAKY
jgi:hypothetical protein